ncbi:MAG: hypothetical protein ABJO38_00420, partial [Stappiaceae bacterium]
MSLPKLWTGQRILALSGLALIAALQAIAGLCVAAAASRLLLGSSVGNSQNHLAIIVGAGACGLVGLRVAERRWAEAFALGYVTH